MHASMALVARIVSSLMTCLSILTVSMTWMKMKTRLFSLRIRLALKGNDIWKMNTTEATMTMSKAISGLQGCVKMLQLEAIALLV